MRSFPARQPSASEFAAAVNQPILSQIVPRLLHNGVQRENILFINFFDDRLTRHLKSLGHNAPKSAVSNYLEWFEDAYFLFTVRIFDASLVRSKTNPKKIYCIDHALVTSVSPGILVNSGHLLENLVFIAIRRTSGEIYYYKTKSGSEVDFITRIKNGNWGLVQVCQSLVEPLTRKREVEALGEAMTEMGLNTGTIVTRSEEEEILVDAGKIQVIAAWRFLLNLPEK